MSDSDTTTETYLTPNELLNRYKGVINSRTLANWRYTDNGPEYLKVGGRVLYPLSGILAWEKSHKRGGR